MHLGGRKGILNISAHTRKRRGSIAPGKIDNKRTFHLHHMSSP